MSLPKLYSLWSASSFVLSVNNLRGGFHHHDPHLTIRKSRANEAAPELELSLVNLSCHRQHTLDIKLFEWDFMGSWSHTMARKFCSCFGILLWQRVLSEDPHKLEKKIPATNSALLIWKGQDTAFRQLLDLWTGKHQDHNFTAFASLKRQVEPCMAIRFMCLQNENRQFCSMLWAHIPGDEMLRVLIFLDLPRNSFSSCCFVHPGFLFIALAFHFCLCPALGLETAMKQTFRNGQLWRSWLGSALYPGVWVGTARTSSRR